MLDFSKPMQTREGRRARLIGRGFWNGDGCGPLLFAVDDMGIERLAFREEDGRYPKMFRGDADASIWDIINAPSPENLVIVQVKEGLAVITQVPDNIVVKVMDYDIEGVPTKELIEDENGKMCRVELHGPAGEYSVWPFA
ncbi:hypothetical protein [Bradyrhizobium sp. HKCCYLS20291]|uniref:hypothetical protein n=1 Tax=Bradyrhizobium sp. HKCCYLS20291 TaxID=3420766 RepID=UPI003EBF5CC2